MTPAYVARGRETEARQHAYHDRIERFYQTLSEHLRDTAPDLLATLAAPPPDVHGYQILPRVVADPAPPAPGTTAGVVSFSWRWSDTLIEREMAGLKRLETGLAQVPPDAGRPREEKLAGFYQRNDPAAAIARFREVVARNATHYGPTLQLAKALDRSGRPDEALEAWKKILATAEAVSDADTIGTARARIGSR